jgi:hypothetical protein
LLLLLSFGLVVAKIKGLHKTTIELAVVDSIAIFPHSYFSP